MYTNKSSQCLNASSSKISGVVYIPFICRSQSGAWYPECVKPNPVFMSGSGKEQIVKGQPMTWGESTFAFQSKKLLVTISV